MQKKRLISLDISLGPYSSFIDRIIEWGKENKSSYVCIANVHMLVEAYNKKTFEKIVNKADLITPDGMPLVKSLEKLYKIKQDRVAGMDLLPDLLNNAEKLGLSIYFYGGSEKTLNKTKEFCSKSNPNLSIVGLYSPPYRNLSEEENNEIINTINSAKPHLVFVILGCPKQEKWMYQMKGKINACMIGVGGALSVMIGQQKRAPLWMQKNSLEWLYRLYQEPKRLFKRYFHSNFKFIYLFMKEYFKNIKKK